mmetsp:Transcript_22542/g.49444  ORF Transcript_22542/g.49444 Transcript_22542/m.49444 type:complete len:210 (+) Transcript_22542:1012-1641(+)
MVGRAKPTAVGLAALRVTSGDGVQHGLAAVAVGSTSTWWVCWCCCCCCGCCRCECGCGCCDCCSCVCGCCCCGCCDCCGWECGCCCTWLGLGCWFSGCWKLGHTCCKEVMLWPAMVSGCPLGDADEFGPCMIWDERSCVCPCKAAQSSLLSLARALISSLINFSSFPMEFCSELCSLLATSVGVVPMASFSPSFLTSLEVLVVNLWTAI